MRYRLSPEALGQLRTLLGMLVEDPLAPTSIRAPARAIDDHLADSLVALELEEVRSATRAADIGSGAGLPGLPLAIALPTVSFTLLESSSRKCAFLDRAGRRCGASNVEVVHARAEAWREGRDRFDVVTARALSSLAVVAEYAAPLLKIGGRLVAWKGRRDEDEEDAARRAAAELGLAPPEVLPVHPYAEAEHRNLHLMSKVSETPGRFPRRPGAAAKRPLGIS